MSNVKMFLDIRNTTIPKREIFGGKGERLSAELSEATSFNPAISLKGRR
jgi:hypothetical protein